MNSIVTAPWLECKKRLASATTTTSAATQTDAVAFFRSFAFAVAVNQIADDVDDAEGDEIIHIVNLFCESAA